MPGVPQKFLTEKCANCGTAITETQWFVCIGLCSGCDEKRLDHELLVAESPVTLARLVEDLEDAEREQAREFQVLDLEDRDLEDDR